VPFASIITPTRGRPALLGRALASLRRQDFADWEAVVVDDGDGEGLAAAAAFDDARVRALPVVGSGMVDARSTAIAAATGELVCWLDDDDWWEDPRHLSLLHAEADRDRRFFFRGGFVVHESDAGVEIEREPYDLDATPESLRSDNTILTSSIAYARELHERLGPLDRSLGGYCDWDFMLRMCEAGILPRRLPGLGIAYAVHPSGSSADFDRPERRRYFERFKAKHDLEIRIANHLLIHAMLSPMAVPDGWAEVDGALEREFRFGGFPEAIAFVNRVAELAEAENHHPDIAVSYRTVTLRWRTHSAEAITERDRDLAGRSAALA